MKVVLAALATTLFISPAAQAYDCDVYHQAIMDCSATHGCDTTIDEFAACLVDKHGITDKADDGVDEIKELVMCFHTEYHCEDSHK